MTSRSRIIASIVVGLLLAACSANGADRERADDRDDEVGDQVTSANPFVQDLWVYDQLRTVDGEGNIVDHTASIIEHFQGSVGDAEALVLIEGMTFTPVADVSAIVKGPNGERRTDVEGIAGVVENELGATFAVLGTVDPDGQRQIEPDDRVFIDMSFLGAAIEPGDVVATDFMLVQLAPTGDDVEATLDPLELFAHRAAAEEIFYSADESGEPIVFANELGRIVVGSMGPEIPTKAQPMLSGFKDGIKKCVSRPGIGCIPNYMAKFGKGATTSLNQIDKQLPMPPREPNVIPPPREYRPPYIPRPRDREPLPCQNGGCGRATGDPHLATFDGHRYDMQAVGELVLARHEVDRVEVQVRTVAHPSGRASMIHTVAVGVGDHRISMDNTQVLLDDEPVTHDELNTGVTGEGFELTRTYRTTTVATDAGHIITLENRSARFVDVVVSPAVDSAGWVGLLGDFDGDAENDLVSSDGTQFDHDLTFDELYGELAMSWRITDDESLFTYADGESTATFTDLTYPAERFTVDDLAPTERRMAEAACRLAGIVSPAVLEECTFDFAITGDVAYLLSAQMSDAVDGILSGRLRPDGSPRDGDGGSDGPDGDDASVNPDPAWDRAWYFNGSILGDDDSVVVVCPSSQSMGLYSLWGDNPYRSTSGVCRAAVHAGFITAAGGPIRVTREPHQDFFPGVERNGQTSTEWDAGGAAFSVAPG